MSKVDWIALGVSIVALGVSGVSIYDSEFSRPDVSVAVGHDVLITKTTGLGPRIGVICSLANEGAKQTIITNAKIEVDSPNVTLPLAMVAESFGGWEESGGAFKPSPTKYSLAAPIPVKGHDKAAAILWFVPLTSFEFTAGRRVFTLSVESQEGVWKRHFDLDLTPTNIADMSKSPYADHPISLVRQY